MTLCNTLWSFAIYLAATLIIPESPVSAFTIQRTKTTTLKSSYDVIDDASVLLKVKHDLPKVNNTKESTVLKDIIFRTQIGSASPTRTFPYINDVNKKIVATSTNKLSSDEKESRQRDVENKYIETTSDFTKLDTTQSTTKEENYVEVTSEINNSTPIEVNILPIEENINKPSIDIITDANYITSTTPFEEKNNDERLLVTEGLFQLNSAHNLQILGFTQSTTTYNESSTSLPDLIVSETKYTYQIENHKTVTDNSLTETMIGEATSSVTKNPSWKTYTTIERKRLITTTELETPSTLESKDLAKSETVTSKVTLDNAANDTQIPSLEELRQELLYSSNIQKPLPETSSFSPSDQSTSSDYVTGIETSSSVSFTNTKTSTGNNLELLSSKRAGFLDLNEKKNDPEDFSTVESLNYNGTGLIAELLEIDAAQTEASHEKPSTQSESLRQLADDAINEELLEEQILNDNLRKTYSEGTRSETTTGYSKDELITDDALNVKPINTKGALYTVSPNYKPMKKIEVQPLKPFVRDPDDNSWRNESLSLLGIVFNANNASKPFTQVLKNKTEAELNNMSDKTDKNEVTNLREKLDKITEVRKSRKKNINKFGDTVYSDYEEGTSGETTSLPNTASVLPLFDADGKLAFVDRTPSTTARPNVTTTAGVYIYKEETVTTKKPTKLNKFAEYYDTTDEYDADYISLPKIDLKKFTTRLFTQETATTPLTVLTTQTKPSNIYLPDRKPTVQYFPPRPRPPKVNVNDYENSFQKKMKLYTFTESPQSVLHILSRGTTPTNPPLRQTYATPSPDLKPPHLDKTLYATFPPRIVEPSNRYATVNDESFNRASYVIKHYKDLINAAAKDDYDKSGDYMSAYTETPLSGVTLNEMSKDKVRSSMDDDYDYMSHKDILNKFVDNFNKNSERFKVDFPILYNSSVVHSQAQMGGNAAASSVFLKRDEGRACAHCEFKVELSPAYELHYYVPEQEEREQLEPKPATLSYTYRL